MSWFSDTLHKILNIFKNVPDELASFIAEYHDQILAIIKNLYENEFKGVPLKQWRDVAYDAVVKELGLIGKDPGTAITIAINIAYALLKAGKA